MRTEAWIPTLLFVAALALLPAWLIGGAALGAAAGLWIAARKPERKNEPQPFSGNVVSISKGKR